MIMIIIMIMIMTKLNNKHNGFKTDKKKQKYFCIFRYSTFGLEKVNIK